MRKRTVTRWIGILLATTLVCSLLPASALAAEIDAEEIDAEEIDAEEIDAGEIDADETGDEGGYEDGDESLTGVYVAEDGNWYYYVDDEIQWEYTGFVANTFFGDCYIEDGMLTFEKNSVIKDETGVLGEPGVWYYVTESMVRYDYTGVADYRNANGWWYIADGVVDFAYTGFGANANGLWYVENGKVTFAKNSVIKDETGVLGEPGVWYYVVGSEVRTDYTGVANYKNANGWWYIADGVVDFDYTGFGANVNGLWYVENGRVTFLTNSVIKDETGAIGDPGVWYYVVGSEVRTNYTGLADYKNANGWWYIADGVVDFDYTGFGANVNGLWYVENGKVTFLTNSVIKDETGAIGDPGVWYYVVGSEVRTDYTGLADYKNANGWWYIRDGVVDFTENTVAKNKNGWWYVLGGKVRFDFTGLANYRNDYGWWYIQDGKVDFTVEGVYKNVNGWWYVKDGKVDFTFHGIAKNDNGWWYIVDGKVDFSFNGTISAGGVTYTVVNGKVDRE